MVDRATRATNIRQRRGERRLTQQELADEAGISLNAVRRAEAGNRSSVPSLVAIATALDCTLADLERPPAAAEPEGDR